MGKSSSSLKRKLAKKSSFKGHEKGKSGHRSRKYKSKKIHRRDYFHSSSDEDDSRSSMSVSSSSTDYSYRHRKAWSHTRKDIKGHKKRARRHSCSSEGSIEAAHVRKRKRYKRKYADSDVRKKTYKKKKPRKEASVSSTSSESRSCSTCQAGSESSDSKFRSRRSRLDSRKNDRRNAEWGRDEANRYRSRSCSSCSCNDSHDHYSWDKYNVVQNSRRLKSVITLTHDEKMDRQSPSNEMESNEHDHGSYSSNGSLSRSSKREWVCPLKSECQKKARVEVEKGYANADIGSVFMDSKKDGEIDPDTSVGTDQYVRKNTTEVSGAGDSFNSDDLESVLRERALENLRKFRQLQRNEKADQNNEVDGVVKQIQVQKEELFKSMPIVENGVVVNGQSNRESFLKGQHSVSSVSGDDLPFSSNVETICDGDLNVRKSAPSGCEVVHLEDHTTPKLVQNLNMPAPSSQISKAGPLLHREIVGESSMIINSQTMSQGSKNIIAHVSSSSWSVPELSSSIVSLSHDGQDELPDKGKGGSQKALTQEVSCTKKLNNQVGSDHNASAEQTIAQGISIVEKYLDGDSATLRSSSCNPSSKESNANKLQDEANESSQFVQKTMQVMRGGERVQVSYKVYIPKKPPALSRRQLKR